MGLCVQVDAYGNVICWLCQYLRGIPFMTGHSCAASWEASPSAHSDPRDYYLGLLSVTEEYKVYPRTTASRWALTAVQGPLTISWAFCWCDQYYVQCTGGLCVCTFVLGRHGFTVNQVKIADKDDMRVLLLVILGSLYMNDAWSSVCASAVVGICIWPIQHISSVSSKGVLCVW